MENASIWHPGVGKQPQLQRKNCTHGLTSCIFELMPPSPSSKGFHAELETHSWNLFAPAFSPSGDFLAVATRNNQGVALIDCNSWSIIHWFPEPNFPPYSLEFSPDGRRLLLSAGGKEPLRCWDVPSRKLNWSLSKVGNHAAFSPNGALVATNKGKSLLVCEATSGR